jgi:hypothetical protein
MFSVYVVRNSTHVTRRGETIQYGASNKLSVPCFCDKAVSISCTWKHVTKVTVLVIVHTIKTFMKTPHTLKMCTVPFEISHGPKENAPPFSKCFEEKTHYLNESNT